MLETIVELNVIISNYFSRYKGRIYTTSKVIINNYLLKNS